MSHHQYPTELHTVCDVVRWAMSEMERFDVSLGHGTADYWEEATFLVLRTLKLPFDRLEAFWNAHLTQDELWEVLKNIESRVHNKVPAPYLVHEAWLTEHPFYVDERVLIPRSYIAELLEEGLEPWVEPENVHTVLDMCTGSGCIAVTLARLIPESRITAVDISEKALSIARENARRLDAKVDFRQGDALGELFPGQREQFDLIVSNPPYIPRSEKASIRVNVTGYEPAEALFVEDGDPLIFYRAIARNARRLLRPGGRLYFEIHENFADETLRMLTREGFPDTAVRRDLNDKNRMTCSLQRR